MWKRIIRRAGIGFLMGMAIGTLIAWASNGWSAGVFSSRYIARFPGMAAAVLIHLLVSGLVGAVAMGSTVVHEIESWSLARAAIVHYLIIELAFVPAALALGWVSGLKELLIMMGIQLAAFLIIWVIMYLRCRAEVRALNELLEENRETQEDKP